MELGRVGVWLGPLSLRPAAGSRGSSRSSGSARSGSARVSGRRSASRRRRRCSPGQSAPSWPPASPTSTRAIRWRWRTAPGRSPTPIRGASCSGSASATLRDSLRVLDVLLHLGHQLRRRFHAVLRLGVLGRALQDLLFGLTTDYVPAAGGRVHLPAIDHLRHRKRLLSPFPRGQTVHQLPSGEALPRGAPFTWRRLLE